LLEASFAHRTLKAYQTGLSSYLNFLEQSKVAVQWPPNVALMTDFIAHLSLREFSPASARLYVAGIGYNCKILNVKDVTQNFVIKKMLLGFAQMKHRTDSRLPLTPSLLCNIFDKLPVGCSSDYESRLFRAAFSLAYFGLFRVGELVADSSSCRAHALLIKNVTFTCRGSVLEIEIQHNKSD